MLGALRDEGIDGLMVEGGGMLLSSFASADLIDHWEVWISSCVTGAGGGILHDGLDPPVQLKAMRVWEYGEDLLVTALPDTGIDQGTC